MNKSEVIEKTVEFMEKYLRQFYSECEWELFFNILHNIEMYK